MQERIDTRDYDNFPVEPWDCFVVQSMPKTEKDFMKADGTYYPPFRWCYVGYENFRELDKAIEFAKYWEKSSQCPTRIYDVGNQKIIWPETTRNKNYYTLETLEDGVWSMLEADTSIYSIRSTADLERAKYPMKLYRVVHELTQTVVY